MTFPDNAQSAEYVVALRRLVDESDGVMNTLGDLSESILPAVEFNLWYEALTDARDVLRRHSDGSGSDRNG